MAIVTRRKVLRALKNVIDERNDRDVVSLGLVDALSIDSGNVAFGILVAPNEASAMEPLRRICEQPYSYGLSTRGDDILRAYQTSGIDPGWRVFRVDQIAILIHTGNTFAGARDGYERNDPGIKEYYWRHA